MMGGVRVLVVEDDVRMAAAIRRGLRFEGLVVDLAGGGEEALRLVRATEYDAIVLDVMMPGLDGFETCRRLRADGVWAPVLMLTARDAVEDRVRGLDGGADDYLTKPFSLAELMARLRALVRRGPVERPAVLEVGDLRLDPATREVWRGDTEIELSAREFALLETFMRRPGQVLTQMQLLEAAWDLGYEQRSNVVEVYVRYLREKIDRPFGVRSIETVRGAGYRLRKDGGERVSRLPIRLRLTAAFALAMVVVLAAAGLFVYLRLEARPRRERDTPGSTHARGRGGGVRRRRRRARPADPEEGFAQLLSAGRARARPAGGARARRSLTPEELDARRQAASGLVEREVPGIEGDARVLARGEPEAGAVVVVGQSLDDRDETLAGLVGLVRDRRADRRAAGLAARLRAGRRRACARSRRCGGARPRSRSSATASGCRCRRRATRSAGWGRRSTRCSTGCATPTSASAASWPTPATSCARRWR